MINIENSIELLPRKEFFTTTWVRDIKLESAIFDLIDNSIDAAKRIRGYKSLEGFEISLKMENNTFIIRDNCGGITLDSAKSNVFKFGNDSTNSCEYDNIVGRYNVGMKRAMFKIGRLIELESHTDIDHFKVKIDVDQWVKKEDWAINLSECCSSYINGTTIKITKINKGIKSEFNKKGYISKLRQDIALKFKDCISKGIKIYLKEEGVLKLIKIGSKKDNDIKVYEKYINVNKYKGNVKVYKCIENMSEAGWNIYFNDRLVVGTNKSKLTGWNLKLISDKYENIVFNEQYYGFRGDLNLNEKSQYSLPFTTTKDGLDRSHENYEKILEILVKAMKAVKINFEKPDEVNISYKRPRTEVEILKVEFNVNSAKAVGEKTYDIYIEKS